MVYNVRDVAAYIVDYSIKINKPISNLKLQKLLYYTQAYFTVKKDLPCFQEEIEHWRHGPVVREVYSEYKMYFNDKINNVKEYNNIKEEDANLIKEVVESYKNYGPWDMVKKTHEEEPWLNTNSDEIIDVYEIKNYFINHKSSILGKE